MSTAPHTADIRPEWANVPTRFDPRVCDRFQSIEMIEDGEAVVYKVDRRGAVVHRRLEKSGLPVSIALPARAFRGVAARAMEDASGTIMVTLELNHPDPKLSVPLLVATDLYDVAADWRGWAEIFDLPMLMIEADGTMQSLDDTLGRIKASAPTPRRASPNRGRRPRFLARRKPGGLGLRMSVAGEEIIARQ